MRGLVVVGTLLAMGYGLNVSGFSGMASGFVGGVGIGSGAIIMRGEEATGVARGGLVRLTQRLGGASAVIGVILGLSVGGWEHGWIWGSLGFGGGAMLGFGAFVVMRARGAHEGVRFGEANDGQEMPKTFDLTDPQDVLKLDRIREEYGALLADESNPYNKSLYRPTSILPYPKPVIRNALETLLDVAEERKSSPYIDFAGKSEFAAETIRSTLIMLDDFLDVPPDQLPTEPRANVRIGAQFRRESGDTRRFTDWQS